MRAVEWSSRVYRCLLILYPHDFREAFGDEMRCLFIELLDDALARRDCGEAIRLWRDALQEAATVGLPRLAREPAFIAFAGSLALTCIWFVPLLWALEHPFELVAATHNAFGGVLR
jgi:hypothetical protein